MGRAMGIVSRGLDGRPDRAGRKHGHRYFTNRHDDGRGRTGASSHEREPARRREEGRGRTCSTVRSWKGGTTGRSIPRSCVGYGSMRFANAIGDKELVAKRSSGMTGCSVAGEPAELPRVAGNAWWIKPEMERGDDHSRGQSRRSQRLRHARVRTDLLTKDDRYLADRQETPITSGQTDRGRPDHQSRFLDRRHVHDHRRAGAGVSGDEGQGLSRPGRWRWRRTWTECSCQWAFYHRADAKFIWGRGDGWVAAGMAECFRIFPPIDPGHARIHGGV